MMTPTKPTHVRVVPGAPLYVVLAAIVVGGCSWQTRSASAPPTSPPTSPPTVSLHSAASIPFKVELVEVRRSRLPAVHSFSAGTSDGRLLVIGGRIAGLHGFGSGNTNFPRASANTMAYVIDLPRNRVLGAVDLVKSLPSSLAGPLTATNAQYAQVGGSLYIIGGYGLDLERDVLTTFGSIVRVDVAGLVQAIISGTAIAPHFAQNATTDDRLKVTGGVLKHAGSVFYLAFGQEFTGIYSIQNRDYNRAGGQFQRYTEKVRVFTLDADLSIAAYNEIDGGYDESLPYHRRDHNVVDVIQSDGSTPGATVYGGVFRAGRIAGFTAPIDIFFSNSVQAVTAVRRDDFQQALSQYDCAEFTVFDRESSSAFTTLFGGISQFRYDWVGVRLVRDSVDLSRGVDGLPFVNTVTTIQRAPGGRFDQFIQPTPLPGLVGSEAQFIRSATLTEAQAFENGVIKLAGFSGRTLVGHIYGGIQSGGPYSSLATTTPSTWASNRLFEVYLTPGATTVLPMPPIPTSATVYP